MAKFKVTVEKMLRQSGVIEVSAKDAASAVEKVDKRLNDFENPLQTNSPDIMWDDPEYEDFTFKTTGDVDDAS
jgi:hypothetical protein